MTPETTWLDNPEYRWIKDHLLQKPGDRLLYRALAAGIPEAPLSAREVWAPTMRELVQAPDPPEEDWCSHHGHPHSA